MYSCLRVERPAERRRGGERDRTWEGEGNGVVVVVVGWNKRLNLTKMDFAA